MKRIFFVLVFLSLSITNASNNSTYGKNDYERGFEMGYLAGQFAAEDNLPTKYNSFSKEKKNYYQGLRNGYIVGYNQKNTEMMEKGEYYGSIPLEILVDRENSSYYDDYE